jgi:hypothetical protein
MHSAPTTNPTSEIVSPDTARALIQSGKAPAGLRVGGHLRLAGERALRALPPGLTAPSVDLSGCVMLERLPAGIQARRLNLSGCTALRELPAGLRCYDLDLGHTAIRSLPADLHVEYRLSLEGCARLEELPAGLRVGSLILRECTALAALPEGLEVYFLDITGCTGLAGWPKRGALRFGRLRARGCVRLRALPPWLEQLAQLDISGCAQLTDLPASLQVSAWIDIADSGVGWLPAGARAARLLWRGVPIDERIAFRPETITAEEVLGEENAELRRVLLERMGYERFLAQARAKVRDTDRDTGGERRLLMVPLPGDEPLVCLAVLCPSTGRQYLLRVPPNMRTCHQAAAWIAGFDNPDLYRPLKET